MKRNDIMLIIGILIISASFIFYNNFKDKQLADNTKFAEIQVKGEIYKTIKISDKEEIVSIETDLGKNVIRVNKDGAQMTEADCPDPEGWHDYLISKKGQVLVCLPNEVIVEIKSDEKVEIDVLSN